MATYTKIKINGEGQYAESAGMFQKEGQNGKYYTGVLNIPEAMEPGKYIVSAFMNKNYTEGGKSPRFNITISRIDEEGTQQTTQAVDNTDLPF